MPDPYEFPLALDCKRKQVDLGHGLLLRLMSDADRQRLLGIDRVKLDSDGRVVSYRSSALGNDFLRPDLERTVTFYASNYLLACEDFERALDLNFALKLVGRSWSSLYIGYRKDGAVGFNSPPGYFGKARLVLGERTLGEVKKYLQAIEARSADTKLRLMRDMWMHAMSDEPRREARFVEISTLLEMLLLPTQANELAFRFALRLAKLVEHFRLGSATTAFEEAKALYAVRSRLVHSGHDSRLSQHEEPAFEYARAFLAKYLLSTSIFDDAALDKLCVGANRVARGF